MSKDQITLDQLIRIAEDKTWEDFEAMQDGRLLLQDRAQTILSEEEEISPSLWVFEMRVGQHFERPMQAIMSCGHFIRMRSAESWGACQLGKLDPAKPNNCLYTQAQTLSWGWRPYIPNLTMQYWTQYGMQHATVSPVSGQLVGSPYQNQYGSIIGGVGAGGWAHGGGGGGSAGLWVQIYKTIAGSGTQ
jgi:hypothetical protein